jgi:transcriptional regulator with GAF, ATPase, and Fis domain
MCAPATNRRRRWLTRRRRSSPAITRHCRPTCQTHLDAVEREILLRALDQHRYNRTAAGASLGLSLRQMRYRMARLGIDGGGGGGD